MRNLIAEYLNLGTPRLFFKFAHFFYEAVVIALDYKSKIRTSALHK